MHALILVDLQNDFTPATADKPEGALAVPEGNAVVPVVNGLVDRFDYVVATQDWHPPGHKSFASQHTGRQVGEVIQWKGLAQVLWPDHCVQGTAGAEFLPSLRTDRIDHIVRKGTDPDIDSYSGFYDNGHAKSTGLAEHLRERDVDGVTIVGLATDYCVKYTALDARREGFEATVVDDACRGVNLSLGDVERAWAEMHQAGVTIIHASAVG